MRRELLRLASLALLLASQSLPGKSDDLTAELKARADRYYPEAVQVRRDLHRLPETCFQEEQTARYIAQFLGRLPLEIQRDIAGFGIRAILRGRRPGATIAIRCDMDALPIEEKTGLAFASAYPGRSHACGHDVHMAGVLITAKMLCDLRERLAGTVVFLFQPCEEGTADDRPGGAEKMVAAGALENPKVDAILGLHLLPGLPAGSIAVRPGPMMANLAWVSVKILGKASHGAFPHQGIDAIYVAAAAIMQFQSLISRQKDPGESAVVSIGTIHGGVRANVIAGDVEMLGTVRTFSFATQKLIEEGMERILKGLSLMYGSGYEFHFTKSTPFVRNDEPLVRRLLPLLRTLLGEENVRNTEPLTISEDFAIYSHRIPAFFFFLGTGRNEALHSSSFDVDEAVLKTSPLVFAAAALHLAANGVPHVQDQN